MHEAIPFIDSSELPGKVIGVGIGVGSF